MLCVKPHVRCSREIGIIGVVALIIPHPLLKRSGGLFSLSSEPGGGVLFGSSAFLAYI
jgi:hypothetical protein